MLGCKLVGGQAGGESFELLANLVQLFYIARSQPLNYHPLAGDRDEAVLLEPTKGFANGAAGETEFCCYSAFDEVIARLELSRQNSLAQDGICFIPQRAALREVDP